MNYDSITDKLRELFDLFKSGAITQDEYDLLKSKIIDENGRQSVKEDKREDPLQIKKPQRHHFRNLIIMGSGLILISIVVFSIISNKTSLTYDGEKRPDVSKIEGINETKNQSQTSKNEIGILKEEATTSAPQTTIPIQASKPVQSNTAIISAFQEALALLGYALPSTNGTLDAKTKEQLISFQRDYQLETSLGKIDEVTAKMLADALQDKNVQDSEQLQRSLNSFSTKTSAPSLSNSGNEHSSRVVSCQSISDNPQNFIGKTITLKLGYSSSLNGRRSLKGNDTEEEKTFSMAVINVYDGNDEYYSRIGDCSGGTNLVLRIPHGLIVPNIISGYITVTGILKDQYTLIVKSISR